MDDLGDVEKLCDLAEDAASKLEELLSLVQFTTISLPEDEVAVFADGVNILADLSASLRLVSRRVRKNIRA